MRFAEITLVVELSETISDSKAEAELMDDVTDTLLRQSQFVSVIRSLHIKDCTNECE